MLDYTPEKEDKFKKQPTVATFGRLTMIRLTLTEKPLPSPSAA
jgi:hypothetical protein